MKLRINGELTEISHPVATIDDLLDVLSLKKRRVAVELNGHVVDPGRFSAAKLNDADRLEIVSFVGGG